MFGDYPPAIVDLLQRTDPAVITEHGAYLHDLTALQGVRGRARVCACVCVCVCMRVSKHEIGETQTV